MKTALFRRRPGTQVHGGEMTLRILHSGPEPAVTVSGRVTIDSSPALRSALLDLLRRPPAPVIVVDLSGVSRLDISGIATLLEASKAAREHSVRLRALGISGQPRVLSELMELDRVFRAAGSEVEFK